MHEDDEDIEFNLKLKVSFLLLSIIFNISSLYKYSEFIETISARVSSLLWWYKRLVSLRDSLLPRLMSGEFDVSDLDI